MRDILSFTGERLAGIIFRLFIYQIARRPIPASKLKRLADKPDGILLDEFIAGSYTFAIPRPAPNLL